jgi:hypothetical protein
MTNHFMVGGIDATVLIVVARRHSEPSTSITANKVRASNVRRDASGEREYSARLARNAGEGG